MSTDRFNEPTDLAALRLSCRVCGAVQKVYLVADKTVKEATADVGCCSCGEKGRFKLAPRTPRIL